MTNAYLNPTVQQFKYYKGLTERAIENLTLEQLQHRPESGSNSIETIMRHIGGNIISRWTHILTTDGEKAWRNRDDEFTDNFSSKDVLMAYWEKAWKVLFDEISTLQESDILRTIYIREEAHTLLEATQRQLAHQAYHVGQIVYLAKWITAQNWNTLTIPKDKSEEYNRDKINNKTPSEWKTETP